MDTKKLPKRSVIKQTESPIEDKLLECFNRYQLFPEIQCEIGNFRVDFLFKELNLVVEADGKDHHTSPEQIERDEKRDKFIKSKGYKVLRFTGSKIYREPEKICKRIIEEYYPEKEEGLFHSNEMSYEEFKEWYKIKKSGYAGYI